MMNWFGKGSDTGVLLNTASYAFFWQICCGSTQLSTFMCLRHVKLSLRSKSVLLLPQARGDTAISGSPDNERVEKESRLLLQAQGKLKVRTLLYLSNFFHVACLVEFVKAFSKLALDATRTERKRIQSLIDTVGRLHKSAQFLSTKVMPGRSALFHAFSGF